MVFEQSYPIKQLETAAATRRTLSRPGGWQAAIPISRVALRWFGFALVVRLVAAIVLHFYSESIGQGGFYPLTSGADDVVYWDMAVEIHNGRPVPPISNIYPWVLAAFFYVPGPSLILGKFLNVLAGAITVYVGVLLTKELTEGHGAAPGTSRSRRLARRAPELAGFFLTFYPSLLFYSTQLVKDPITVLLGVWALYLEVRFLRRPRVIYPILWALATGGLFLLRGYAALVLGLSALIFRLRFQPKWLLPALLTGAILPNVLGWGWFGWAYIQPWLNTENLQTFRGVHYSTGGSAAGIKVDYSNPLSFLTTYGYSFATAMFGPFPWQISASAQAVALPEAMVMWILFPLWLQGVWRVARGRLEKGGLLMIFSLFLIGVVALFSDNIGANTRLRLLPWSAFFIYAALHMPRFKLRQRRQKAAYRRQPAADRI